VVEGQQRQPGRIQNEAGLPSGGSGIQVGGPLRRVQLAPAGDQAARCPVQADRVEEMTIAFQKICSTAF
jgi:hypothetical protein